MIKLMARSIRSFLVALSLALLTAGALSAQSSPFSSNYTTSITSTSTPSLALRKSRRPDGYQIEKKYRDRSTYGIYVFGGFTLSSFFGSEAPKWKGHIAGIEPGYTVGVGFDHLRQKNGIYFGSEIALTAKGTARKYAKSQYFDDPASSSRLVLQYLQITPMKIGWTISCSDNFGVGIYTGFGVDWLMWGHQRESNGSRPAMRKVAGWNGKYDLFVPINLNFDYKQWTVGMVYDVGVKSVVKREETNNSSAGALANPGSVQHVHCLHNNSMSFRLIYHFRFKERGGNATQKESKENDKYKRYIF